MERKLASIQKIGNIIPIDGYDKVELAEVLGWTCIVGKGDFKKNDYCVYFEPDSQLYPSEVWDSFLSRRKYRIKTIRMCGVVSQGLALPVSIISKLTNKKVILNEGLDLTEILSVEHFEKGKQGKEKSEKIIKSKNKFVNYMMKFKWFRIIYKFLFLNNAKGEFPTKYIKKTDESNIQTMPSILKSGEIFYITEKLEGQSATYILLPKKGIINRILGKKHFEVCSHNIKLPHPDKSNWWEIANGYDIKNKLKLYYKKHRNHMAIQGEIVGPKIQDNIYKLSNIDFYVFNVKNLNTGKYLNLKDKLEFCKEVGLKMVPIISDKIYLNDEDSNSMLKMSNGYSLLNKNVRREGFVVRSVDNDTVSFKVRSPKYLLGEK